MLEKEITFDRFVRGLLVLAGIAAAILLINYLSSVLAPFFIAWFAAYLFYPIVIFFQHKLHLRSRILSIFVTLALVGAIVYGFCALTVPSIIEEADHFKQGVIEFVENGSDNKSISPKVEEFIHRQVRELNLDKLINQKNLISVVKEVAPRVWNVVYQTAGVIIGIISSFIGLLYFFFILVDYEKLTRGIMKLVPQGQKAFFSTLFSDLAKGMNSYFRGQALIALCVGILFSIGFLIIGFPLAIPLGLFIGVLSFVPYLHALGLVPAFILCIFKAADTGQNFWLVLASCLAVFLVVQIIEDTILTPKIMGNAVGLPPFLILLSLSVWGYMLGIIGMIIALPLTTLILSYYRRYVVGDKKLP